MNTTLFVGVLIGIIIVLVILVLRKGSSSGSSASSPTVNQAPAPVQKTGSKHAVPPTPAKTVTKHAVSGATPPPPAKTMTKHAAPPPPAAPQPVKYAEKSTVPVPQPAPQPTKYAEKSASGSKDVDKQSDKQVPGAAHSTAPVPPDRLVDEGDDANAVKRPLK